VVRLVGRWVGQSLGPLHSPGESVTNLLDKSPYTKCYKRGEGVGNGRARATGG
jgi:hypothetical protein